jgi:hypothetical protein
MPDGINSERGNVAFDDSTLSSRRDGYDPLWFYGYGTNCFFVGQHGMTFHAKEGNDAALYPPVCVKGSTARANAPLKKTGPGSLALVLPYQHPLVVEEGDLRLRNLSHNWEQMPSQTPTLAAGSKLVAAGEGAFGRLTIPAGTPLVLRAQGMETSQHGNWYCTGWAAVRPDGLISLTDRRSSSYGSAHLKNKVDVSKYHELRTEYERLAHEIIDDPFKVLTENGRHVASIIGMDDSVCREALEMGAVAAGVTGTGPAIAIVCEQSLTEEISRKFKNTIVCRVR